MSSQIPPLVCHTPPPDFGDDEDDLPDDDDEQGDGFDDYDGSTGLPAVVSTSNLPTPIPPAFSDGESAPVTPAKMVPPAPRLEDVPDDEDDEEVGGNDRLELPVVNAAVPRMESPPSLILSQHNYSENDLPSEDDQDDEEFQDFAFHPHIPPEDITPAGAEDNLSIPSLHLDTELSKSATPVQLSENEASDRNLSPQEDPNENPPAATLDDDDDDEEDVPAELTTPVVAEDLGARFVDDNTENDFTDFTTASNDARSSAVLEVPTANDVSFDDDFAQLESTPSADSNFVSGSRTTDFATFDADFSKFDSFQASFPATFDEPVAVAKEEKSVTATADPAQDDFDDFQEFAKFPTGSTSFAQPAPAATTGDASVADAGDEEDDDFGEFSDFKQSEVVATPVVPAASIPTSRSALFKSDSILAVITGMFPSVASSEEQSDTGQKDGGGGGGTAMGEDKICRELRDMDSTQALSYQYSSSESNKALVRALGIDARNILFGPKWNSSMPRFAANLSFSPLEPMKPTSSAPASSGSSLATTTTAVSASSVIPMTGKQEAAAVRHHAFGLDPLQPPISAGTAAMVPGTVPAVQFDWNSSGLVNPLEGNCRNLIGSDSPSLSHHSNVGFLWFMV